MTAVELRPGVIRYESALWETTALALHAGGEAVLVDPCISAPEIAAIAGDVAARGLEVRGLLITHADWDHVCGLYAFPGVPAIMSRGAAERIASGQAAEEVVREGAAEGLSWEGAPRADLVFEPGEALQVGPFTVETMALPGHTACGAGYRVRELDLLCVGDYLSVIEFPFVYVSTAAYRATLAALLDSLERDPVEHVAPGHGRAAERRRGAARSRARISTTCTPSSRRCARHSSAVRRASEAIAAGAAVECHAGRGMTTAGCGRTMPNSSSPSSPRRLTSCSSSSASSARSSCCALFFVVLGVIVVVLGRPFVERLAARSIEDRLGTPVSVSIAVPVRPGVTRGEVGQRHGGRAKQFERNGLRLAGAQAVYHGVGVARSPT